MKKNELEDTCRDHGRFEREQNIQVIMKMKISVDKFRCSLDTAKEKINKLVDWSEEIVWNVAQRDSMVENTDEMSIYYMLLFI